MSTHTWVKDPGAEAMWDSWQDAHRPNIELAFKLLPKVESVYEVGCGAGANLRMLREKFPKFRLGGSEPHDKLREFAAEHLGLCVDEAELPWTPKGWDVFVTCYVMAYVEPLVIEETFRRAASRYFIVLEPTAWAIPFVKPSMYRQGSKKLPLYAHDFLSIFKRTGWRVMWRWPIVPHYQGLNNLIIVEHN